MVSQPQSAGDKGQNKVRSLLVEQDAVAHIRAKYDEIYRNSDVWLYKKSHGVHSAVLLLIKDLLPGKRYLDVGCGAGRLPIMCAHLAAQATGFDFSEAAIDIARLNALCANQRVDFSTADIEGFCRTADQTYDVVTMIGVLEHVPDPVETLGQIASITAPGGRLLISCPNFINPRGFGYMTLLTLFDLPMSLADLRQVDYMDIQEWAGRTGFSVERSAGAIYRFGWDRTAPDMIRRVPLAVRDAQLDLPVRYDTYNRWQERMVEPSARVLQWLETKGVLKRIQRTLDIHLERKMDIDDSLWEKMVSYMNEDISSDPYYCEEPPFCFMGGEGIYILEKK